MATKQSYFERFDNEDGSVLVRVYKLKEVPDALGRPQGLNDGEPLVYEGDEDGALAFIAKHHKEPQ